MNKLSICILVSFLMLANCFALSKPTNLTSGKLFNEPLGYNLEGGLSWQIEKGQMQTSCQIQIFSEDQKILWTQTEEKSGSWRSNFVKISESFRFESGTKYIWRVRYWNEQQEMSDWSDFASFETGLVTNEAWKGSKWISSPFPPQKRIAAKKVVQDWLPPTYFRKEFNLDKSQLKKARCYIAVKGIFQAYVNGKKVGNDFWGTGWTKYKNRIQTNTYDITDLLKDGNNVVSAVIGDGWYAGRLTWNNKRGFYGHKPELLMKLRFTNKDETSFDVNSDDSWKCGHFAFIDSDIYDGETYDASLEPKGWQKSSFSENADEWHRPIVSDIAEKPLLEQRRNEPIRAEMALTPISMRKISDGTYIFDFGQNLVGIPQIFVKGNKGQKITLHFAEMLNKDGSLYTQNYRSAKSTDTYFCAGESSGETYTPLFTYHGFRYMEVSGLSEEPKIEDMKALVLHNDMEFTGNFVCSKEKLNLLQNNIQWGQRGNFFSTPTDCPQRDERLGWTGDAQVFAPTACFNMNVLGFFSKWCLDMRDAQKQSGECPSVAPSVLDSYGSPAWADAMVICPWEMYLAYGDRSILEENYKAMRKWVIFQKNTAKNYIRPEVGYGDWLQPTGDVRGGTPKSLIGTAYLARTAKILANAAKIQKNADDEAFFEEIFQKTKAAFNREFVKPDGEVKSNMQTAYLLPLAFDLLDKDVRQKVFNKFLKVLEKDNYYLNTGFVGTPLISRVLTDFGRKDLAFRLLNNEGYPSWIYPINQGATTMWERWNSYSHEKGFGDAGMNSFNHYAYGAIGKWMYSDIAGINYNEKVPGYREITLSPKMGGDITSASATHKSPFGEISSSWKLKGDKLYWYVSIPGNSRGNVTLPKCDLSKTTVNGSYQFADKRSFRLASGDYTIVLENVAK